MDLITTSEHGMYFVVWIAPSTLYPLLCEYNLKEKTKLAASFPVCASFPCFRKNHPGLLTFASARFCCQFRTASCHWLWDSKRNNIGCENPQGCLLPLTGLIFSWMILTWKTGAWGWHFLMAESFLMIIHLWWNVRKCSKPKLSAWACRVFGVPLGHNPSVFCNHLCYEKPQRYPSMHQPSSSAMGVYITLPEIISLSDLCAQSKLSPAGFRDGLQR